MKPDELARLVGDFRALHKLPAAVIVTFEQGQVYFAISVSDISPDGNLKALREEGPKVLRDLANKIESGELLNNMKPMAVTQE